MTQAANVVRVAAAQLAPRVGELDANRALALEAIGAAADAGAEVVVLPELVSSGYVFDSRDEAISLAEAASGPTVSGWLEAARRRDIVVVGGFCEAGDDGSLHNSAAVVGPRGVRAVYRKTHLWDSEKGVFEAGDSPPPLVETDRFTIGLAICYDIDFPELTRDLALAGADILAFPTNSPDLGEPSVPFPMEVVVAMATAHVNRVFVAIADRCGTERGVEWVGGSVVVGSDGWPLARPHVDREPALVVADCDIQEARDKSWGPANDLFADRRPELYAGAGTRDLGDFTEER